MKEARLKSTNATYFASYVESIFKSMCISVHTCKKKGDRERGGRDLKGTGRREGENNKTHVT